MIGWKKEAMHAGVRKNVTEKFENVQNYSNKQYHLREA
jgi:hypothetical protein